MDIGKSFSFVFEDQRWVNKVLIGGGLVFISFLIVPIFVVLGYMAQLMRNILAGEEQPLPEWTDFGAYLTDGLKLFVVLLIYFVPYIVLSMLSGIRNVGPLFSCLAFIYALAVQIILPAAVGEYVTKNDIAAALKFQDIFAMVQANIGDFLVAFLIGIVAQIVAAVGLIACFIGVVFTAFYASLVRSHVWAQVYQRARGGGTQAVVETTPL
jgi:hypothetical protein